MKNTIRIIPAIDLMNGQCVRLSQGKKERKTVYSDNPSAMALSFQEAGAERLHIIDLDGAFSGNQQNYDVIRNIRKTVSMKIEVGGGIRSSETIQTLMNIGVDYAILGTRAFRDEEWLREQIDKFGDAIIVGVDARDGFLTSHGWTETENIQAVDYVSKLEAMGIGSVIYTDVKRDGMLSGPNLEALSQIARATKISVIASGGIHTIDDVRNIKALDISNITGIITGKAIYEKTLDLAEAVKTLHEK